MNRSQINKMDLDKVRRDLEDAAGALGAVWTANDHDSIGRLTNAGEGLLRAIATLTPVVERLAELVVDD